MHFYKKSVLFLLAALSACSQGMTDIQFTLQHGISDFLPGQTIKGILSISSDSNIKFVRIRGKGEEGYVTSNFYARETYEKAFLVWDDVAFNDLCAGEVHNLPFEFVIPNVNFPSPMKEGVKWLDDNHSYIKYWLEAEIELDRFFSTKVVTHEIRIHSYYPANPSGLSLTRTKSITWLSALDEEDTLKMKADIPGAVYTPGETMKISWWIDNDTRKCVRGVEFKLKEYACILDGKDHVGITKVKCRETFVLGPRESTDGKTSLKLPTELPATSGGMTMHRRYYLVFTAWVGGSLMPRSVTVEKEIFINVSPSAVSGPVPPPLRSFEEWNHKN